jgi:hypothetical protein
MMTIEISPNRTTWTNISNRVTRATHKIASRELETLEFTVTNPSSAISVGMYVRAKRGTVTVFEGIIYEVRRQKSANVVEFDVRAYSELVLYDRHVVFRLYDTGTTAGAIIRDLASLEAGVNVTNVDNGPSLTAPWSIENMPALRVMLDVARGTNYYLRMKPGKVLHFKPKTVGSPKATLDETDVLAAEYAEDRWRLKNRVVYVGADGQVLADVSEPPGDLPVVVHDPFLTDPAEAQRRANIRLALNKEFGRQIRIVVPMRVVEDAGLDLFDTVQVNITDLGLSDADFYVVEMSFDPREKKYELTLGGRLELFEDYLSEALGGDVASRFGPRPSVIGEIADLRSTLYLTQKVITASSYRFVTYWNKRPVTIYGGQNVTINPVTGMVELASGFTSGYADIKFLPPTETFRRWGYVEWISYPGNGTITVKVMDPQGNVLVQKSDPGFAGWHLAKRLRLKRWPGRAQEITRRPANRLWIGINAEVFASSGGLVSGSCIGMRPSGPGMGEMVYQLPSATDFSWARFATFFLYAFSLNTTVKLRLYTDPGNYYEGTVTVTEPDVWKEYLLDISTFSRIGNPSLGNITQIGVAINGPILFDADYLMHQYLRGQLVVRFELSRPLPTAESPKISSISITYEEVTTK